MGRILAGIIIIIIGFSFFVGFSIIRFALAVFIIFIGVRMLTGKGKRWDIQTSSSEDYIHEVAIFSPINKVINSDNFKGGRIIMVFAGGQIDISKVKTKEKEVPLEVVAIFGGGKIIVPKGWKVNSQGTAIFGGYNSRVEAGDGEAVLDVRGAAIFGGVEIAD